MPEVAGPVRKQMVVRNEEVQARTKEQTE
jgi:hypothetical protein